MESPLPSAIVEALQTLSVVLCKHGLRLEAISIRRAAKSYVHEYGIATPSGIVKVKQEL